jgi:hypothetical protein
MSTLRTSVKFLDTLMNKVTKKEFYLVLKENLHTVWVIDPEGKNEPKEMPKSMLNMAYIKVDPMVVKILYGDKEDEQVVNDPNSPDTDSKPK